MSKILKRYKVLIGGPDGHGKSEFAAATGLRFANSSEFLFERAVWPALASKYKTKDHCKTQKYNDREIWKEAIHRYSLSDKARIGREIWSSHDVYCGIRLLDEFRAIMANFNYVYMVYVISPLRIGIPDNISPKDILASDVQPNDIVFNDGPISELKDKAEAFGNKIRQMDKIVTNGYYGEKML